MRKMMVFAATVLSLTISGCNWVPLTEEGELTRLVREGELLSRCKQVGTLKVSVKARVAGIDRDAETVAEELSNLARNGAEDFGGDTVVAISDVNDGVQRYAIYRCIK